MKEMKHALLGALFVAVLSGCCSTDHVANPKDITLSNALVSISQALDAMRREGLSNKPFGLLPSEVEVTFNVSASREKAGELKLDLSAPVASPVTASAGGSTSFKATANRGNQITLKFTNLLLVSPDQTLIGKSGSNAVELMKYLRQEGPVIKQEQKP